MSSNVHPIQQEIHLHQPVLLPGIRSPSKTYIIYFITGNPGLIEYYRSFLTQLYGLLSSSDSLTRFHVYGRSLSGFEVETPPGKGSANTKPPPYSLDEQIEESEATLRDLVDDVRKETDEAHEPRVILMGHSVGAYILLEITRRLAGIKGFGRNVQIAGGVCLFPTVTHIMKSENGRKSSWLLTMTPFAYLASLIVKFLTLPISVAFLAILVKNVMGFPSDAAHVTASFIKSANGVQQALHMARDEMLQITTDNWGTEIWGAATLEPTNSQPGPILRFLFAESDHWVANETRNELIEARGTLLERGKIVHDVEDGHAIEEWKPVMEIDEKEGWPHAFCIKHSIPVAERVAEYVRGIVKRDSGRR